MSNATAARMHRAAARANREVMNAEDSQVKAQRQERALDYSLDAATETKYSNNIQAAGPATQAVGAAKAKDNERAASYHDQAAHEHESTVDVD